MKVSELIEYLRTLDPFLRVAVPQYSDFVELDRSDITQRQLSDQNGWLMRTRPDYPGTSQANVGDWLVIG